MNLVSNRIFPTRPPQDSHYPLVYFEHISTSGLSVINGFYVAFAETFWREHIVGDRDASYTDIDPILNLVFPLLNRTYTTSGGNQMSTRVDQTAPISLPFDIEADQYPRYILPVRIPVSFN